MMEKAYFLLWTAESYSDADLWLGIFTDIPSLKNAYEKALQEEEYQSHWTSLLILEFNLNVMTRRKGIATQLLKRVCEDAKSILTHPW